MTAAAPRPEPEPLPASIAGPATTPEFDLLLACCRVPLGRDPEQVDIAQAPGMDGVHLVQLAEYHGVVPRVYASLSASVLLTAEVREALRQRSEANARRALWLTHELRRVLDCLESRGMAALAYKGPVLAEQLYGDVAQRQFSDLDVLVHQANVPQVASLLRELGYDCGIKLSQRQERAYLASGYEYTFDRGEQRNLLEIQWQVLPRFYAVDFDMDGIFRRAVPVKLAGRAVKTLGPEDLLMVLCVHAAKHAWVRLSWLCDIVRLTECRTIDWGAVRLQARHLGIARIMATTLALADTLLDTKLAASLGLPDARLQKTWQEIMPSMADAAEYDAESLSYFRLMLRSRERWRDRMRFLWRLASTPGPQEWSAVQLPDWLFPLYRGVRVFRVAARLGR
jgi:hypothetical protein